MKICKTQMCAQLSWNDIFVMMIDVLEMIPIVSSAVAKPTSV